MWDKEVVSINRIDPMYILCIRIFYLLILHQTHTQNIIGKVILITFYLNIMYCNICGERFMKLQNCNASFHNVVFGVLTTVNLQDTYEHTRAQTAPT